MPSFCRARSLNSEARSYIIRASVFGMAVLVISSILIGCGGKDSYGELREEVSGSDLKSCEEKMNLIFPNGAKPLGIWTEPAPNDSIKLKIQMTKSELNIFLEQSPFKDSELHGDAGATFGPNVQWWDPGKVEGMKVGHAKLTDPSGDVTIGVHEPQKGPVVVYLVWVKTKA